MDFDHRDGSLKFDSISSIVNRRASKKLLLSELKKCDLVCVNCHRIRSHRRKGKSGYKDNYANQMFESVTLLKETAFCTDCKLSFPGYVMEFDHLDPSIKTIEVGAMFKLHYSLPSILDEIKKCEIVCARCHRIREKKRRLLR
jgi:hypothetical protein